MARTPSGPTIYLRGNLYWFHFTVRHVRFREPAGTGDAEEARRTAARRWVEELERAGRPVPEGARPQLTLREIAASLLARATERAAEKNPKYVATLEQHLDHLLPRWTFPGDVTEAGWDEAMREIHSAVIMRPRKKGGDPVPVIGKDGKPKTHTWATISRISVTLRQLLELAHEKGALQVVPRIKSPPHKLILMDQAPRRALTDDECEKLFAEIPEGEGKRWLLVDYYVGLRKGEINNLCLRWIDFTKNEILLPAKYSKGRRVTPAKAMHPLAAQAIREQIAARRSEHPEVTSIDPDLPIFEEKSHRRLFFTAATRAGIDLHGVVPHHTGRHTTLTQVAASGGQEALLAVQAQAGHASAVTSSKYLHPATEHAKRAMDRRHTWPTKKKQP